MKERFISVVMGTSMLIVFQPFTFPEFGWWRLLYIAGLVAMVMLSATVSEMILRHVLRKPSNDLQQGEESVRRRNLYFQAMNVVLLTFGIAYFNSLMLNGEDAQFTLLNIGKVFMIMIFVSVIIGTYWRAKYHSRFLSQQLEEAERLNGILQERQRLATQHMEKAVAAARATALHFGGSTKEAVDCTDQEFLYAESDGNYVKVHYLVDDAVTMNAIRCSIKEVDEKMAHVRHIMRCHRAFIVNLSHVKSVESRSSGFYLALEHSDALVPVSKTYQQAVKQHLNRPEA
ncbi:MAG: LytTR family DNA-binding domain-containing protein [Bacteroidales bacterium]|nr:LytTR family DNA-binding domain-containing protein [Bacteroidales bacterium]